MDKTFCLTLAVGLLSGMLICATFPKVKNAVNESKEKVVECAKTLKKKADKTLEKLKEANDEEEKG